MLSAHCMGSKFRFTMRTKLVFVLLCNVTWQPRDESKKGTTAKSDSNTQSLFVDCENKLLLQETNLFTNITASKS